MRRKVGKWMLGLHECDVVGVDGADGGCGHPSSSNGRLYMTVGLEQSWRDCVATLLHEALEVQFWVLGCAYSRGWTQSEDVSSTTFVADHRQFDEASCNVGHFASQSLRPLRRVYDAHQKALRAKEREAAKKKKAKK